MAEPSGESTFEDLLRTLAPQVLGVLVRRYGQFAECEDAVQEALLEAALQWPASGVPDNPKVVAAHGRHAAFGGLLAQRKCPAGTRTTRGGLGTAAQRGAFFDQ